MRIAVAMSGGVDSSTAAALLRESGHEVFGLSMRLWDASCARGVGSAGRSCCSPEDLYDAAEVARAIGIPHYVLDMEELFDRDVVDLFVHEYLAGRTPNPCIVCNQKIKFEALLKRSLGLGAEKLATGHYARIVRDEPGGCYRLLRGRDGGKDQSYFLYGMSQGELAQTLFPVGGMTKNDVRERAKALGLSVASKHESQEICFLPDGDVTRLVLRRGAGLAPGPGPVVEESGRRLGWHKGIQAYTVGQRKGMGIGGGPPLYVLEIRPERNEIVVGPPESLSCDATTLAGLHWVSGGPPRGLAGITGRIRYRHPEVACEILVLEEGRARVGFERPQTAVTPGQALVFYRGEEVLGGGWIEKPERKAA